MSAPRPLPTVDIVIPVLNEAHVLRGAIRRLVAHLEAMPEFTANVVIADNGSHDGTADVANELAAEMERVRCLRLEQRGRGLALRTAWQASAADVVAYMDVDLSTGLGHLEPLLRAVASGACDVATGSRLAAGARVRRSLRRTVISRVYNLLLRRVLGLRVRDAQCGFKALSRPAAEALLPFVRDTGWFFDTELLVLAQRRGYHTAEIPVDWVEDLDSRVRVVATAIDDLRGIARLWRSR